MKILICGGEGQLARAFAAHLLRAYPSGEVRAPSHDELDVSSAEQVQSILHAFRPDIVINTAAYHKVDECESHIARAFEVNAWGGYVVAKASKDIGARSMYISTGYVFDGKKSDPYEESDAPNPLNVYGHSKALGEKLIFSADSSALIVRTNGLFGEYVNKKTKGGVGNFVDFVAGEAKAGRDLFMVSDQRLTPTYTGDLVEACITFLMEPATHADTDGGIIHLTNSGETTWFDVARKIYAIKGSSGRVLPVTTAERAARLAAESKPALAARPANALLENRRWGAFGNAALPHWEDALERYLALRHS